MCCISRFKVIFSAVTGGRRFYNPSSSVDTDFYGYNSSKTLHFKFDLHKFGGLPYHCSNKSSCSGSPNDPLRISEDVTRVSTLHPYVAMLFEWRAFNLFIFKYFDNVIMTYSRSVLVTETSVLPWLNHNVIKSINGYIEPIQQSVLIPPSWLI